LRGTLSVVAGDKRRAADQLQLVLSDLACVDVRIEYERDRKAWVVSWLDGPTAAAVRDRAEALSRYGVAAALPAGELSWRREHSPPAWAAGYLWAATGALTPDIDPGPVTDATPGR
jgi:hypothetical protein